MKYIVDYLTGFFDYLGNLFERIGLLILSVIEMIGHAVSFLFAVIGALPTLIKVVALGIVIACVLYKILGREGGEAS